MKLNVGFSVLESVSYGHGDQPRDMLQTQLKLVTVFGVLFQVLISGTPEKIVRGTTLTGGAMIALLNSMVTSLNSAGHVRVVDVWAAIVENVAEDAALKVFPSAYVCRVSEIRFALLRCLFALCCWHWQACKCYDAVMAVADISLPIPGAALKGRHSVALDAARREVDTYPRDVLSLAEARLDKHAAARFADLCLENANSQWSAFAPKFEEIASSAANLPELGSRGELLVCASVTVVDAHSAALNRMQESLHPNVYSGS
jgi:hypothetical protein